MDQGVRYKNFVYCLILLIYLHRDIKSTLKLVTFKFIKQVITLRFII